MPETTQDCRKLILASVALCSIFTNPIWSLSQSPSLSQLVATGQVDVGGHEVAYRVRHLPVSSFPDLPAPIAEELNSRGCLIPQTYQAHRPENVIHGSLEYAGSRDWAALCAAGGQVSLLIFFGSSSANNPIVMDKYAETDRLQKHDPSGELGFNWGIDAATPQRLHDALAGTPRRPAPLDHDSLADSILESKTIYHMYRNGEWERVVVDQTL
jgi:hypothetical protein